MDRATLRSLDLSAFADLPTEQQQLVERLGAKLNPFLEAVGDRLDTFVDRRAVSFTVPSGVVTSTLGNSWVSYDAGATFGVPAYVKLEDGTVRLSGVARSGTNGATAFTLPAAYRPDHKRTFLCVASFGGVVTPGRVDVGADGAVALAVGGAGACDYIGLDGISFLAADRAPVTPGSLFPLVVNLSTSGVRPASVSAVACTDVTGRGFTPAPMPRICWEPHNNSTTQAIKITNVLGLVPGRSYQLTVEIS